jgi:hypothetical protein
MHLCRYCGCKLILIEGVGWCDLRVRKDGGGFDICKSASPVFLHSPLKKERKVLNAS